MERYYNRKDITDYLKDLEMKACSEMELYDIDLSAKDHLTYKHPIQLN